MLAPICAEDWAFPAPDTGITQECPEGENQTSIVRLGIVIDGEPGQHKGYPENHGDLPLQAAGRYQVRPGCEKHLEICWQIDGFEHVLAADLQIYTRDSTLVSYVAIKSAKDSLETYAEPTGSRITAFRYKDGPFLVRLRITKTKPGTRIVTRVKRFYFDVLPVVIVGGGIAGLRAAETLLKRSATDSVVILEARDYMGGRARTVDFAGKAVDLGCQFLQDADTNPLLNEISDKKDVFWHCQEGSTRLSDQNTILKDGGKAWKNAFPYSDPREEHVSEDRSFLESIRMTIGDEKVINRRMLRLLIADSAELDEGIEPNLFTKFEPKENADNVEGDATSNDDTATSDDEAPINGDNEAETEDVDNERTAGTSNKMHRSGLGAFIAQKTKNLLEDRKDLLSSYNNQQVKQIETGERYVKLVTAAGIFHACGVVLTVPTEIIAQHGQDNQYAITFSPPLPLAVTDAYDKLPMGHYKKVFLPLEEDSVLSGKFRDMVEDGVEQSDRSKTDPYVTTLSEQDVPWKFLYRMDANMIVAFVGGTAVLDLEKLEDDSLAETALKVLGAALEMASDAIIACWTGEVMTSKWSSDPLCRGAYTYTTPNGGAAARKLLRETVVGGRMVFGGEATRSATDEYATAHGAWLSGETAASLLLDNLD